LFERVFGWWPALNSGAAWRYAIRPLPGRLLQFHGHPAVRLREDGKAGDGKIFFPITYLETDGARIPPMFLARPGHDEVPTMLDLIDRFVVKALSASVALTIMNHPQGVHGFDNQNDDDRSRETIARPLNS
jgi:hypothetical protein